jgi:voltage-gated potassium channel
MSRWWSHRIVRALALLAVLTVIGTIGYMIIEGWGLVDAFYMVVAILSTVGLEAPHPLSHGGRLFTTALIIIGVSVAAYILSALGEYVTGGVVTGLFRQQRLAHSIRRLTGHYIVCGYGRVGRQVAADLHKRGFGVVVIEPARIESGTNSELIISGDAADDAVLLDAGITRAHGLVAATGDDATNLVITLSARALAPDLTILARASESSAESKLLHAGATHVVSPYAIGGHRIAAELLSPGVTAFFDTVVHAQDLDLGLELTTIAADSVLIGRTLGDALPPSPHNLNIVAFRRAGSAEFITNPPRDTSLAVGDTVVAIGPQSAMQHLGNRTGGAGRWRARVPKDGRRRAAEQAHAERAH